MIVDNVPLFLLSLHSFATIFPVYDIIVIEFESDKTPHPKSSVFLFLFLFFFFFEISYGFFLIPFQIRAFDTVLMILILSYRSA